MKRLLIFAASMFLCAALDAQIFQEWAVRYNYWTQNGNDSAVAMVLDDSANVYVTGVSAGTNGYKDFLTVKYTTGGVPVWSQRYNGAGNWHDHANAMAIDDSGNVYVTGTSFGGGSTPTNNYLTIKYSRAGVLQWAVEYDYAVNYDEATDIEVDDSGFVFVTGWGTSTNGEDYVTLKYDANGNLVWTADYNGLSNNSDFAYEIGLDSMSGVYVCGTTSGVNLNVDIATVKYNSAGAQQWVQIKNGNLNGNEVFGAMETDPSGNVYVGAHIENGSNGRAVFKYNSSGAPQWTANSGTGVTWTNFYDIVVDAAGNVYATGGDESSMWNYETYKYTSSGAQVWYQAYNGTGNASAIQRWWRAPHETGRRRQSWWGP